MMELLTPIALIYSINDNLIPYIISKKNGF